MSLRPVLAAGLLLPLLLGPARAAPQEPRVSVRPSYVILHDLFGKSPAATPAFIRQNLEFLESQPIDGLAVYIHTADQSLNVTINILKNEAIGYDRIAQTLAPIKNLKVPRLSQHFA